MIPKVIHYCWFGNNPKPKIVRRCIDSWHKYCPDYEIIEWNEDNIDVSFSTYAKEAYDCKKWGFVVDPVRLYIIYEHGGIYLDTDVELVRPLDDLLDKTCFFAGDGSGVNGGLGFGAVKGHPTIRKMYDLYENRHFVTESGMDLTPCTTLYTRLFLEDGYNIHSDTIEHAAGAEILPPEYFSPLTGMSELKATENTFGIHWSIRTWESGMTKFKTNMRLLIGYKNTNRIKILINRLRGK